MKDPDLVPELLSVKASTKRVLPVVKVFVGELPVAGSPDCQELFFAYHIFPLSKSIATPTISLVVQEA